jgi:hypothetical protein
MLGEHLKREILTIEVYPKPACRVRLSIHVKYNLSKLKEVFFLLT